MPKYKKFTPIEKIIPRSYLQNQHPEEKQDVLDEIVHSQQIQEPSQKVDEDFLNDLPDDEESDIEEDSLFSKIKNSIKIIIIVSVIFVLVNSTALTNIISRVNGMTIACQPGQSVPTVLGTAALGCIAGLIYVLINRFILG